MNLRPPDSCLQDGVEHNSVQPQEMASPAAAAKKTAHPVVSVIIPAYNYARFLPCTLRNILSETGVTTDIVVVDDGSQDDTRAVAASFGSAIRYIYQENQGLSAARNTGIQASKGDFVVFLDADDLLSPGTLTSQSEMLVRNPKADMVVCHNTLFNEPEPDGTIYSTGEFRLPKESEVLALGFCNRNQAPVHAVMLRRSVMESVGFFDASLHAVEDYDYWLRCVAKGGQIAINHRGLALYRQHGQSLSKKLQHQLLHEAVLRGRIAELLQNNPAFMEGLKANGWILHAARCFDLSATLDGLVKNLSQELLNSGINAIMTAAAAPSGDEKARRTEGAERLTLYYALVCRFYFDSLSSAGMGYFTEARAALKALYPETSLARQQRFQMGKEIYDSLMCSTNNCAGC